MEIGPLIQSHTCGQVGNWWKAQLNKEYGCVVKKIVWDCTDCCGDCIADISFEDLDTGNTIICSKSIMTTQDYYDIDISSESCGNTAYYVY
eukprot:13495577-Ditylum_brightwellii.AAC.1